MDLLRKIAGQGTMEARTQVRASFFARIRERSVSVREYLDAIKGILDSVEESQRGNMRLAAIEIAGAIERDAIIYVFGCGHSHLPALDAFYRAGGLGNVSPMLDGDLMLHDGAAKSSRMEKMPGIAAHVFGRYSPSKEDVLVVISASGKNAVPVEMAKIARANSVKTIAIASSRYAAHGGVLANEADIAIDSMVPYGDAAIEAGGCMMGGLSTASSSFILNSILIEGARIAAERGVKLPVYLSGNVEGGKEANLAIEKRYLGRIKNL